MKIKRVRKIHVPIPKVIQVMFPKKTIRIYSNDFGLYVYQNFVLDEKTKQVIGKYLGDGRIETNLNAQDILVAKELKLL